MAASACCVPAPAGRLHADSSEPLAAAAAAAALPRQASGCLTAAAVHDVIRSSAALTAVPGLQTAGIQQFHAQAQAAKQVAKQVYVQQQLEYGRFGALLEFATVSPAAETAYQDIKLQGRPQDAIDRFSTSRDSRVLA